MPGYFSGKAWVYGMMFCESVPFYVLQHDYVCLQSLYVAELRIEINIHSNEHYNGGEMKIY